MKKKKKVKSLTKLFKSKSRWEAWSEAGSGSLPPRNNYGFPSCLQENLSLATSHSFALNSVNPSPMLIPASEGTMLETPPCNFQLFLWFTNSQATLFTSKHQQYQTISPFSDCLKHQTATLHSHLKTHHMLRIKSQNPAAALMQAANQS